MRTRECACGCGETFEVGWGGQQEYVDRAHRMRAYRRRQKAGTVIPQKVRLREAQRKRVDAAAAELEQAKRSLEWARQAVQRASTALAAEAAKLQAMQPTLPLASKEPCPDRRKHRAKWSRWVTARLGTMADVDLAALAGVTPSTITRRRRAAGVPAWKAST